MLGVICTNPVTGCVEPWTIAGPTDGSTNIVHHDENRDYQLATANDSQYGASYLGITECCKPLYNPSTGTMTAEHFNGVASEVDINANSDTNCAQSFLVQGTVTESGVTSNSNTLEKTNVCYNANCYVCNDPVTGDPVCKPTVHIPTLCVDELLGYNDGLPRRNNVCEDCWRNIPFIGEDNGEETLDTSSACDAFRHNSCTCTTKMVHLEISDICQCGDIYIGNRAFNPNTFEYYTKDPTNAFNTKYVGFASMNAGFNLYDFDTTNNRCRYRLSLSESSSAIDTNSLTISPACSASLSLTLTSLPYVCNTENINYTPLAVNSSYGNVKKMDGFSYDPATCYLCGNFCGNINIFPYNYNWTDNTGKTCLKVDNYGFNISNWCGANTSALLTVGRDYVSASSRCGCIGLGSDHNGAQLVSCSDAYVSANNCLHLFSCNGTYIAGCSTITIQAPRNTNNYSDHTFETLRWEDNNKQCTSIFNDYNELRFVACQNGTVLACHDIYTGNSYGCPNRLLVCCDANVGWQAYALMCDLNNAGDTAYVTDSHNYTSFADLLSCIASCKTVVPGVFNFSSAITFSDSRGQSYQADELVGTFFKQTPTTGHFNGMFRWPSRGLFSINFWYSNSSISAQWTIVTPVPGTLYGCVTPTTLNVLGNL